MTYSEEVLADSPLHYWRLSEPGGLSIRDLGSSPQNMYVNSGAPLLGYSGPNTDGGSCYFNGSSYFQSAAQETQAPSLTVEAWIFQAAPPAGDSYAFSVANFKIGTQSSTEYELGSVTGTALVSTTVVSAASWHHLVLLVSSTALTLYLDGAFVTNLAHVSSSQTDYDYVGAGPGGGNMKGWAAECALYPSVLSAGRISAHFGAADQIAVGPTFQIGGYIDPVTGALISDNSLLRAILSSVRRTFPNTP